MKPIALKFRHGFTLVELLVVMSIIIVLLLLVLSVGRTVREKSLIDDTRSRLRIWAAVVQTYQDQTQLVPRCLTDPTAVDKQRYHWPLDIESDGSRVNTLPMNRRQLSAMGSSVGTQRKDAWGNDMYYRCLSTEKADMGGRVRLPQEPFFWSNGPDGKANMFDPTNKETTPGNPGYDPNNIYNLDNIFSFEQ